MNEGKGDKMKKRIIAAVILIFCVVGAFAAVTAVEPQVSMEAATKKKVPSINTVYSAVKKAYGEDYIPNMRLSEDEANTRYGISGSWYSGVIAEIPMMNVHSDELVIVKAKNSSAKKKIKSALTAYQKKLKEDTFQYPANQLKLQASRVYVKGNYVCFFSLGMISDAQAAQSDESKVIEAYKAENAKAVKAIQKLYK